jgi:hypothetical protein
MYRQISFDILPEEIENGEPWHSTKCPVALALRRMNLGFGNPVVSRDRVLFETTINDLKYYRRASVPLELTEWMTMFDDRKSVYPISTRIFVHE